MIALQPTIRLGALRNGGHAIAFSPQGDLLVYGGGDPLAGSRCVREVACWRPPDQLLWTHEDRGRRVQAVAFSPDGQRLLCAEQGPHLAELDARTGAVGRRIEAHPKNSVNGVAYAPDGSTFATASWDMTVKLWRAEDATLLATLSGDEDSFGGVRFSPDGRHVVAGSGQVTVWAADSGKIVRRVEGHSVVEFSPDGRRLVSVGEGPKKKGEIVLIETAGWTVVRKTAAHARACNAVCFSPDGRFLATSGDDKQVLVWEVAGGKQVAKVEGRSSANSGMIGLAWSPDGRALACADSGGFRQPGRVALFCIEPA
jgi:WD40 repeat protein